MSMLQFFAYPKKILIWTGIWPCKNLSYFYVFRGALAFLCIILLFFCLTYNAAFQVNNFVKFSESLYMLTSIINTLLKMTMLAKNRKIFMQLMALLEMESFTRFEEIYVEMVEGFKQTVNFYQNVYWIEVNLTVLFLSLYPIIESASLPMDFPHFNDGLFHYPFYVFEVVSLNLAAYENMAIDQLTVGMISVAAVQLKILNKKLADTDNNIKKSSTGDLEVEALTYITECCKHYTDIENFINCLLEAFSVVVFVQLGTSVVAICNAGILVLTVDLVSIEALSLLLYMITMFAQLGLYCWIGNVVYLESLEITTSCYFSQWNERGTNVRRTLFMLMERTKRPLQIRGLRFFTLNFTTFIAILQWSYSYFTLLKNYTKDLLESPGQFPK